MNEKIHLKHHCNLPNHEIPDIAGWLNLANHKTMCWTDITDSIHVTTDPSQVTCKKCIKKMANTDIINAAKQLAAVCDELPFCECGCGERVAKKGNRFIHGHNMRGVTRTPEHSAAISKSKLGVPQSPEHNAAVSKTLTGVPHTPERIAAVLEGLKNSDAHKAQIESMRGGDDLVTHHYIYDHDDLSKNTVKMTRSDHMKLHRLLQKLGYIVPRINVKENEGDK